jgi:hypothetical protein
MSSRTDSAERDDFIFVPSKSRHVNIEKGGYGGRGELFPYKPNEEEQEWVSQGMKTQILSTISRIDSKELKNIQHMYFVLGLPITHFERQRSSEPRLKVFDNYAKNLLKRLSAKILAYLNEQHNKLLVACPRSKLYEAILQKKYSTRYFENVKRLGPLLFTEQVSESLRIDPQWRRIAKPSLINIVPNISNELKSDYLKVLLEYLERIQVEIIDYDKMGFILANLNRIDTTKLLQESNFVFNVSSAPQGVIEKSNNDMITKNTYKPTTIENITLQKLPIICLMDSGVNDISPLKNLIVMKNGVVGFRDFDDGCSPDGHGTIVACLATRGEDLCEPKARIISYKLYSDNRKNVLYQGILRAITRHSRQTRIFISSINFKKDQHEATAFLDRYVQEKNICVIFSAGNIKKEKILQQLSSKSPYPLYIREFPVYDPARAINIVAVGSISKKDSPSTIAQKNRVAPFSRCGANNPLLYDCPKPEVVQNGGNVHVDGTTSGVGLESFCKNGNKIEGIVGTSLSSPLFARKIVEIEAKYGKMIENAETLKAIALASSNSEVQECIGFGEPNSFSNCDKNHALIVSEGQIPLYDTTLEGKYYRVYTSEVPVKIPKHVEKIEMFIAHSDNHTISIMPSLNTFLNVKGLKSGRENPNRPVRLDNHTEAYRKAHMKVFRWSFTRKSMEADWKFVIEPKVIADMHPEQRRDTTVRYGCGILITAKTTRPQTQSLSKELAKMNKAVWK